MRGLTRAQLVVAGDGEERERLEVLARRCRAPVRFVGSVDGSEKQKLLQACDVVVIPSVILAHGQTEGTPVVCLEAMAAGKAIIASRVGGIPEIIQDGVNGFLVEPARIGELRKTLQRVLDDEILRQRVGCQARLAVQPVDWRVIGQHYRRLIRGVSA
jgi:glycosyltransferase involved in cell wall biosynthesis